MSANASAQPLLTYPLYHRAPRASVGHEVRDADGALVAMMTFHPQEQQRAADLAQLVAARLNRANAAAAAATGSVRDDLWHLINNAVVSASIHGEDPATAADRVRQGIAAFFAVDRDPPLNKVDPELVKLADVVAGFMQECDAGGFIGEACELRMGVSYLRSLNSPNLVINDAARRKWRMRRGMVDETLTYLTRMATDPKRCGAHAENLRALVAAVWRLYDDVTVTPSPSSAQNQAA